MKTSKSNSEINRPLQYTIIWLCSKASKIMFCQPKYNHCTHVSERNIWVNFKAYQRFIRHLNLWKKCFFQNIWTAVNVLGVIEKCCSNPFNVQTANFIPKPHKVIESRTSVKKANLECYWNNFVLLLWRHVQLVKSVWGHWGRRTFEDGGWNLRLWPPKKFIKLKILLPTSEM